MLLSKNQGSSVSLFFCVFFYCGLVGSPWKGGLISKRDAVMAFCLTEWPQYGLHKIPRIFKRIILGESSPAWPQERNTLQSQSPKSSMLSRGSWESEGILCVGEM